MKRGLCFLSLALIAALVAPAWAGAATITRPTGRDGHTR